MSSRCISGCHTELPFTLDEKYMYVFGDEEAAYILIVAIKLMSLYTPPHVHVEVKVTRMCLIMDSHTMAYVAKLGHSYHSL